MQLDCVYSQNIEWCKFLSGDQIAKQSLCSSTISCYFTPWSIDCFYVMKGDSCHAIESCKEIFCVSEKKMHVSTHVCCSPMNHLV